MNKPNQIGRKSNRESSRSQGKKPETKRVRVTMPLALKEAVRQGAKKRGITPSLFFEEAIGAEIAHMEAISSRPPPEIPEDWKEVASIDFTGYPGRDCEERIIYKTPAGDLKAARSSSDQPFEAIEDVQREQVLRWINECVIPEEFEEDFGRALQPKPDGVRPLSLLETVQLEATTVFNAQTYLEDAADRSAALLEALAALLELTDSSEQSKLSDSAVEGLQLLAMQEGANLRDRFENYTQLLLKGRMLPAEGVVVVK
jgi:hypothetical protein